MRTRGATAAVLLAAGLALTGCSFSHSTKPVPTTTAPAITATAGYDPQLWKQRVTSFIGDLDQAQAGCSASPSSDACATALQDAGGKFLAMQQALGSDAGRYPATTDQLKKIVDGYNAYISDNCPGNTADAQASDCRSDMATVLLGVATLPAKMTADSPPSSGPELHSPA